MSDDGYLHAPYSAFRVGTGSPWITHSGTWYTRQDTIAGPIDTPWYTNATGSISFLAPGTNAYWWVGVADAPVELQYKLFIDDIDQHAVLWGHYINASTTYGWHNWTIQVTGESGGLVGWAYLYTEGGGKGSYKPAEWVGIWGSSSYYVPSWLSFGDKDQWRWNNHKQAPGWTTDVKDQWMTIRPPKGTAHAAAWSCAFPGDRPAFAAYTVTITPDPVNGGNVRSYIRSQYGDGLPWESPIFLADLDPKKQYEIKVTNDGDGYLGIDRASFTKAKDVLKIILPTVLISLLVIAVVVGAFWWRRRRRRKALMAPPQEPRLIAQDTRSDGRGELFVIDDSDHVRTSPMTEARVTPYPMGAAAAPPATTLSTSESDQNLRSGGDEYAVDGGPVPVREQFPPRYDPQWSGAAQAGTTTGTEGSPSTPSQKRETP